MPDNTLTPSTLDIYLALSHIGQASGALAPLAGEAPEETPRVHVARTMTGEWRVFVRPDLPAAIRAKLLAWGPQTLFTDLPRVARLLAPEHAPDAPTHDLDHLGVWVGRTLLFPADLAETLARRPLVDVARLEPGADHYGAPAPAAARLRPALLPPTAPVPPRDVFPGEQFAALADGMVVATCESARESELAAEAWVRTVPAARGQGYATRVTAAWALDARRRGKIPFYSHNRANVASAGVARALGLIPFLEDVGYL
jgi:hypothetical protein